jgi:hypothetical protein
MKSTRKEYLQFFTNWLFYQYDRPSDKLRNLLLIREVKNIVTDDDEAAYWGDRDCWTMHGLASDAMKAKAIEAITA